VCSKRPKAVSGSEFILDHLVVSYGRFEGLSRGINSSDFLSITEPSLWLDGGRRQGSYE